jgi:hypothetical protein
VDELRLRRFMSCGLSGDWRADPQSGGLDLCAVLSCPVPGFPIPRSRVASGAPMALVAAGALAPPVQPFGRRVDPQWGSGGEAAETLSAGKVTIGDAAINSISLGRLTFGDAGEIRMYPSTTTTYASAHTTPNPSPADLADLIAARLDERKAAGELSATHAALVAELDDTPAVVASLLAEVDDTPEAMAALLADLDDGACSGGDADPKELSADEVSEEDLQALADLAAEEGLDEAAFLSKMPAQLRASYLRGKVAARIRWGSGGDFNRCVAQATKHGVPGHMRKGMCNILHRQATGHAPGRH